MARKLKKYRVHVVRKEEGWIEVDATTEAKAKEIAEEIVHGGDQCVLDSMSGEDGHDYVAFATGIEEIETWYLQKRERTRNGKWETIKEYRSNDEATSDMLSRDLPGGPPPKVDCMYRVVGPDRIVCAEASTLRSMRDMARKGTMGKKVRV